MVYVPERPWAKVGVDLFGRDYLCMVDYTSNFWEIEHLPTTDAKRFSKLKSQFARYGIPDQVVSDNVLCTPLLAHTTARQMAKWRRG